MSAAANFRERPANRAELLELTLLRRLTEPRGTADRWAVASLLLPLNWLLALPTRRTR